MIFEIFFHSTVTNSRTAPLEKTVQKNSLILAFEKKAKECGIPKLQFFHILALHIQLYYYIAFICTIHAKAYYKICHPISPQYYKLQFFFSGYFLLLDRHGITVFKITVSTVWRQWKFYCPDSTTVDNSNENYTNTVFIKYIFLLKQVYKILPHCFICICHSMSGKC